MCDAVPLLRKTAHLQSVFQSCAALQLGLRVAGYPIDQLKGRRTKIRRCFSEPIIIKYMFLIKTTLD